MAAAMADTNHKPECAKNRIYVLACDCGYTPPADAASPYWLDGKVIRKGSQYVAEIIGQEPLLLRELLTGKDAHKPEPADAALADAAAIDCLRACAEAMRIFDRPDTAAEVDRATDVIAAALRARAVPDGVTLVTRSFSHPNEGDIVIPTAILSFRQGDHRDDATWKERDKFVDAMQAMLAASKEWK